MKFGIREITNVMMKAKSAMRLGNKVYYKDEPVLYFDSLKTSSLEGAATTVYAQGGRGNSRLVAWEGERTLTFNMEDALLSTESFAVLSGAGLIENVKIKDKDTTIIPSDAIYGWDEMPHIGSVDEEFTDLCIVGPTYGYLQLPTNKKISNVTINFLNFDRDKLSLYYQKYHPTEIDIINFIEGSMDEEWDVYESALDQFFKGSVDIKLVLFKNVNDQIYSASCAGVRDGLKIELNQKITDGEKLYYAFGFVNEYTDESAIAELENILTTLNENENIYPLLIPVISYEIDKSELITGYEHVVEKTNIKSEDGTSSGSLVFSLLKDAASHVYLKHPNNFLKSGVSYNETGEILPANTVITLDRDADLYVGDEWTGPAIADYYTPIYNKTVKQLTIDPDKFGGNFYLEADTLFRDIYGADHAATFIIPNCKVQSNFTMTMASSGDPSTFSFVLDAFPGYTRFDPSKKVLACLQINEKGIYEEDLEDRAETPWAPGAELYN